MKVLQIYKTYFPDTLGGVEQVIKTIHRETARYGVEQRLLTVSAKPCENAVDGLPTLRFKTSFEMASCPFSYQFFKSFKHIAKGFDLLHFHYPWPFADFSYLLNQVNTPALVTFHADALKHRCLKKIYAPFQKKFLQKLNCIVPTSLTLMQSSPDLRDFHAKCTVIPIGIDESFYPAPPSPSSATWQQQLGEGFVLFVGVLRHYKGLHTLIDAAKKTSATIVIAGSGPLEQELKNQAGAAKLSNIHFVGRVSEADKQILYTLCGMVVLPSNSRAEAFGISLVEGLIYKKPLISTRLGTGTSYVNQHEKTGLVIDPENPAALAHAIETLKEPSLAKKMGESGYAWFLAEFQSAIMGQRYFELYQRLLAQ